jgi:Spy/CpxP family protein refolding chaperone
MTNYKSVAFATAVLVLSGAAAVAEAPPLVTDSPPPQDAMEHGATDRGCPMMQPDVMGSMPDMMDEGVMGQGMMGRGMMGRGMMGQGMGQGMMGLPDADLTAEQRRRMADLYAERARRQFMLMHDMRAPRERLRELMAAEQPDVRAIGNAYDEVAKLQKDALMLELRAQEEVQNIMRDARAQAP